MAQRANNSELDRNRALRVLAQTALRIADGEAVDTNWLIEQLQAPESSSDGRQLTASGPLLTVPEVSQKLRVSRWSVYDLIHRRQLLSVKIGRRRFVPSGELSRYVNSLPLVGGQLL